MPARNVVVPVFVGTSSSRIEPGATHQVGYTNRQVIQPVHRRIGLNVMRTDSRCSCLPSVQSCPGSVRHWRLSGLRCPGPLLRSQSRSRHLPTHSRRVVGRNRARGRHRTGRRARSGFDRLVDDFVLAGLGLNIDTARSRELHHALGHGQPTPADIELSRRCRDGAPPLRTIRVSVISTIHTSMGRVRRRALSAFGEMSQSVVRRGAILFACCCLSFAGCVENKND